MKIFYTLKFPTNIKMEKNRGKMPVANDVERITAFLYKKLLQTSNNKNNEQQVINRQRI